MALGLVLVFVVGGDDGPSGDDAVGSAAEAIADLDAAGIDGCNLEADEPPDGIDPGDAQIFIEGALGVAQNAEAAGDEQRPDPVDTGSCSGPPAGVALAVFADEDATREYDGWFATHVEDCVPRVVGANWMAVTLSTESDSSQTELAERVADTLGGEVTERCEGGDDGPAETPPGEALEEYPPEFEDNFLSSCVAAGGTDDSCQCALDRIQATFTVEEFIELDQQSAGGEIPPVLAETIADCL